MTDNVIRINANIKAPDFTVMKPPKNPEDYQLDCREFQNRQTLEDAIQERFYQKGVVLLMNTGLKNVDELKQWAKILTSDFMPYKGGDSPRNKIADHVYDVKGEVPFLYVYHHNEMSYLPRFPQCVFFGCLAIPNQGGETLLADNVAVTHEILQTELGQKLKEKGIRHIRNYTSANNTSTHIVYKHWQNVFYLDSKEQMENFAQREGWTFKWMEQDNIRISYRTDAYEYNEVIEENVLFTSLGNNGAYFDDMPPFNTLPFDKRPFHTTYGDGEAFTEKELEYLARIFDNHTLPIFWQPGWIAMIDNERWTHARPPFSLKEGEKREIYIVTGKMKTRLGAKFS